MVRLYGEVKSNDSISANATHTTYRDTLDGYLELIGIMVIPDYDPSDGSSNLDTMTVRVEDKECPNLFPFKVNYYANMLPFAQFHPGKRPLNVFTPSVKIAKDKKFELVFKAGSSAVSNRYYVRPVGYLYTDDEVREIFGIDPDDWEYQPGGIAQTRENPFIKYGTNEEATSPREWLDIDNLSLKLYADQELELHAIGVKPADHSAELRIVDQFGNIRGLEKPFTIKKTLNELPFGCAWQDAGPYVFPEPVRRDLTFRDDRMSVQIRDDGTSVSAGEVIVWVKGILRGGGA